MCNSERLLVVLSLLCETSQNQLPIFDAACASLEFHWCARRDVGPTRMQQKKTLVVGIYPYFKAAASYFMESSSSTAIIAVLETAKSACLEIMSPVVMSAEKLGKENNLLQDKISALELELSNAKAENLALQGRVNELQECNVF